VDFDALRNECNDFLLLHKGIAEPDYSCSITSLLTAAKSLPKPYDPSRPEVLDQFQADQSKLSKQFESIYLIWVNILGFRLLFFS
jgi:hypothetical protein